MRLECVGDNKIGGRMRGRSPSVRVLTPTYANHITVIIFCHGQTKKKKPKIKNEAKKEQTKNKPICNRKTMMVHKVGLLMRMLKQLNGVTE